MRLALWLSLLWFVTRARADLEVGMIIAGTDYISQGLIGDGYGLSIWYSDPQVDVRPCDPGTFSDDYSGVCRPCGGCTAQSFAVESCSTTTDTTCVNCTVCTDHQIEECACNVITPTCYTGDRVCYTVLPLSIFINITFTTTAPLTIAQTQDFANRMRTGYVRWLVEAVGAPNATFDAIVPLGNNDYVIYFTLPEVFEQTIIEDVRLGGPSFFLQGFSYVGLARRRLLALSFPSFVLTGVGTSCLILTHCPRFFTLLVTGVPCTNQCVAAPCPPGYTGNFGLCVACPEDTYKPTSGNGTCISCPTGHSSGPNSTQCSGSARPSTTPRPTTTSVKTTPSPTTTMVTTTIVTTATLHTTATATLTTPTTTHTTSTTPTPTTTSVITYTAAPITPTTTATTWPKVITIVETSYSTPMMLVTAVGFMSMFCGFMCGYYAPHEPLPLPIIPIRIN